MVLHNCNLSICEVETGGSEVQSHPATQWVPVAIMGYMKALHSKQTRVELKFTFSPSCFLFLSLSIILPITHFSWKYIQTFPLVACQYFVVFPLKGPNFYLLFNVLFLRDSWVLWAFSHELPALSAETRNGSSERAVLVRDHWAISPDPVL